MTSGLTSGHKVTLPQATISIPARQIPDAVALPHLKLTVTPQVTIPDDLAPRNAKGKAVEDLFKIVVPIGGKVAVSWHVDTTALFGVGRHTDAEQIQRMLEDKVLEWLESNKEILGVHHLEPSTDKRTQVTLLPWASNPTGSPFSRHMIPHGEPTAHLRRLGIELSWAYPSKTGKRRMSADASDEEDPDGPEPRPSPRSTFRQRHFSPPATNENAVLSGSAPGVHDLCTELVYQVGGGMQHVLRMQMIRRFAFIFDLDFQIYQEPLSLPPAAFTAIARFLSLSSAHQTPLLGECRPLITSTQSVQAVQLERRVLDMARVATYKSRSKRVRTDITQADPRERERLEAVEDDEPATRMASYLQRLALEDMKTSEDLKIRRSLSEGVAALGAARWARARRSGVARMSARKVELVEVAADSVPQLDPEPDAEYLADHDESDHAPECYDVILPPPLRPSLHHPVAPRTSIVELPEDNEDIVDDLGDWDSSDDHVVTPPPHLQAGGGDYRVDYEYDHHAANNFIRNRSNSLGLSHVGVRDSIDFDSGLMNSLPREGTLSAAESGPLWEHFQARLAGFSLRDRMAPRTQYDNDVVNDLDDEATWSPGFNPNLGALPEGADLDEEVDPFDYEEASPQDSFEDSPPESQGVGGAVASQPQWAPLFHPRLQAMETSATPSPMMRLPERLLEEAGTPAGTPRAAPASAASYQGGIGGFTRGRNVNADIENDLDELDEDEAYLDGSQGYEAGGEWGEQGQCGDYEAELGHGIRFSNHEAAVPDDPEEAVYNDLDELDDEW